jgi:hypothetical protein
MEYIKFFDILGPNPVFYTESKPKFQTFLGGIFSIIYFLLTFIISLYLFIQTMSRSNYQIVYNEISNLNATYDIQKNPVILGALTQDGIPLLESYVTYKAVFKRLQGLNLSYEEVPMVKCKKEFIDPKKLELLYEDFQGITEFFWCLDPDYSVNRPLYGKQGQGLPFGYYIFYPVLCNNSTSNNSCETIEKINGALNSALQVMAFVDYQMDHDKINDPGTLYTKAYTMPLSLQYFYKYTFRFRNVEYYTDYGYILNSIHTDLYFTMEDYYISSIGIRGNEDLPDSLMQLYLSLSDKKPVYSRTFEKLQSAIAYISGIVKILFIMASFTQKVFLKNLFYQHLINSLAINIDISKIKRIENTEYKSNNISALRRISSNLNGMSSSSRKDESQLYLSQKNEK